MTRSQLRLIGGGDGDCAGGAMDERALVTAAKGGDEQAFADLVRRHSPGMHRVVARMILDDEEAWDVVQMALFRAWQRLDRYDERWRFATWVYRIATNIAIDLLRSRGSRERVVAAATSRQVLRLVEGPESLTERSERADVGRVLRSILPALTPQQRAAFVLREVEGMDTADVASVLGCSSSTVRNHVFQARKTLRREMESRFPEYVPRAKRV